MQRLNFRGGVADDAEAIFEVMEKSFRVEKNSDRWHSWYNLAVRVLFDAERFFHYLKDGFSVISNAATEIQSLHILSSHNKISLF
jgi:hypothetical protein